MRKQHLSGHHIWVAARTHAFEAVASWVAEGLIRWLISENLETAALRSKAVLNIIPIIDIDSVELGCSGKHRPPIDFNRDFSDSPHWQVVKRITESIDESGKIDFYIDLHGPGGRERETYLYVQSEDETSPDYEKDLENFCRLLREVATVPAAFGGRMFRPCQGPDDQGQSMAGAGYWYFFRKY